MNALMIVNAKIHSVPIPAQAEGYPRDGQIRKTPDNPRQKFPLFGLKDLNPAGMIRLHKEEGPLQLPDSGMGRRRRDMVFFG
jgi:hypothetical protein